MSVLSQDTEGNFEYEIIAVLDKKDKESQSWLEDEALLNKRLKVYRSDIPGVNSARNLGIKESKGEIIYFIDDDCILPEKSQLINLCEGFKSHPDASAIGGGYITENNARDIFRLSRNQSDNFYLEANVNPLGASNALLGGNAAYKKEAFSKYGFFDESIRFGAAETELNDRILKGAGKIYFVKGLSILHSTGKQGLGAYFIKSFLQGRGKAYSIAKNGSPGIISNNKAGKIWFMHIAMSLRANLIYRVIAALFLFLSSLCYSGGLLSGKIRYHSGVKEYGQ